MAVYISKNGARVGAEGFVADAPELTLCWVTRLDEYTGRRCRQQQTVHEQLPVLWHPKDLTLGELGIHLACCYALGVLD